MKRRDREGVGICMGALAKAMDTAKQVGTFLKVSETESFSDPQSKGRLSYTEHTQRRTGFRAGICVKYTVQLKKMSANTF